MNWDPPNVPEQRFLRVEKGCGTLKFRVHSYAYLFIEYYVLINDDTIRNASCFIYSAGQKACDGCILIDLHPWARLS